MGHLEDVVDEWGGVGGVREVRGVALRLWRHGRACVGGRRGCGLGGGGAEDPTKAPPYRAAARWLRRSGFLCANHHRYITAGAGRISASLSQLALVSRVAVMKASLVHQS